MTPYRDDQALAYRNAEIERRHTALLKSLDQRTREERTAVAHQVAVQASGSLVLYALCASMCAEPFFAHPHLAAVIGSLNVFVAAVGAAFRKYGN
jgi:hypothetical protein